MHNLLITAPFIKEMVASCCTSNKATYTSLLLVTHLFFAPLPKAFFAMPGKRQAPLAWFPLSHSFSARKATSSHFKRNPLRFMCVVISIKQLEVHFFITISDFVYKGQTQFYCKSLGEMLLTFSQLIQNIEAVKPSCLDVHCKSSDL